MNTKSIHNVHSAAHPKLDQALIGCATGWKMRIGYDDVAQ